jgi:hypothetical protein
MAINSNELNIDFKRREEIIFGRSIIWDDELGDCEFFEDLTLDKLAQLLEENFAEPQQTQNNSPTIQEFYEFGQKSQNLGYEPFFIGYVVSPDREDYRTSIEGIQMSLEAETIDSRIYADFVSAFKRFAETAHEKDISSRLLYAWWD